MSQVKLPDNFIEARRYLLRNYPFYGIPALGCDIILTDDIPTACTNGKAMMFNPQFIHKMPIPHLAFVIAHESIHVICKHPDMMAQAKWPDNSALNPCKLNKAADYWINLNLKDGEKMQFCTNILPLYDPNYVNHAIRQIYDKLPDPEGGEKGKGGNIGSGDDVIPHRLTPEEATDQRIKVRQAYGAAKSMGKVPAWAEQMIEDMTHPKVDYRDLVRAFLATSLAKDRLSWRHLNKRYLPDFYAPIVAGTTCGTIGVGLDTSGSVWSKAPEFVSEFNGILSQLSPAITHLLPFDTELKHPQVFAQGELVQPGFKVYGGGGTDFRPVFNYLADKQPTCLIMLTDMMGCFPDVAPPYPVLWVSVSDVTAAPFGTVIHADL